MGVEMATLRVFIDRDKSIQHSYRMVASTPDFISTSINLDGLDLLLFGYGIGYYTLTYNEKIGLDGIAE